MESAKVYTKSQIEKLGNALIYLCEQIKPITKTHLLKLVFIIEEISVARTGIPFFDLRFDVWKLGPVSKDLFVELSDEPNLLSDFITKEYKADAFYIVPKKEFSDDEFSDNDMALIDEVCQRFRYCTAKELVNFTHRKNTPWYNAAVKNGILDELESGKLNTTDIEINLGELVENDTGKLSLFNQHKDFLRQTQLLKR